MIARQSFKAPKIQIILELCELQFTSSLRPLSSSSCCCSWRQLCLSQLPSCGQVWSAFHSPQRIKSDLQIWFFLPGEHQVTVYASHWTVATSEKSPTYSPLCIFLALMVLQNALSPKEKWGTNSLNFHIQRILGCRAIKRSAWSSASKFRSAWRSLALAAHHVWSKIRCCHHNCFSKKISKKVYTRLIFMSNLSLAHNTRYPILRIATFEAVNNTACLLQSVRKQCQDVPNEPGKPPFSLSDIPEGTLDSKGHGLRSSCLCCGDKQNP